MDSRKTEKMGSRKAKKKGSQNTEKMDLQKTEKMDLQKTEKMNLQKTEKMDSQKTEALHPLFAEGQFSDADEDSPESHAECKTLNAALTSLQLDNQEPCTTMRDRIPETRNGEIDPNSLIQFHFEKHPKNDDDDYFDDDYDYPEVPRSAWGKKNICQTNSASITTLSTKKAKVFHPEQFSSRLCFDEFTPHQYTHDMSGVERSGRTVKSNKDGKKTTDKVLDERTTQVVKKYLTNCVIDHIDGSISTGKEANVYFCWSEKYGGPCAIKIYRTTIMEFKARDQYIMGNFKFRNGRHPKQNSRKKIEVWAAQEFSNLHKLYDAGLPCPQPFKLVSNCLLMQFLGDNEGPAPLLKDVEMSPKKATELYLSLVLDMWTMYNVCKLVHADLSEFNLLLHNSRVYIIDVSQSVTLEHQSSSKYLRNDCYNITVFFRKRGVATLTLQEFFHFITDQAITLANRDVCFEKLKEKAAERGPRPLTAEERREEEVFRRTFIPNRISEVINPERDYYDMKEGYLKPDELDYQAVIGMAPDMSAAATFPKIFLPENEQPSSSTSNPSTDHKSASIAALNSSIENIPGTCLRSTNGVPSKGDSKSVHFESLSDKENEGVVSVEKEEIELETEKVHSQSKLQHPDRYKGETTEEKKARKKVVKDAKAEKRKTKIPKYEKKRSTKKK